MLAEESEVSRADTVSKSESNQRGFHHDSDPRLITKWPGFTPQSAETWGTLWRWCTRGGGGCWGNRQVVWGKSIKGL